MLRKTAANESPKNTWRTKSASLRKETAAAGGDVEAVDEAEDEAEVAAETIHRPLIWLILITAPSPPGITRFLVDSHIAAKQPSTDIQYAAREPSHPPFYNLKANF